MLAAVAIACFLAAIGAANRRATQLSLIIGLGIPAQALVGGVTVLTDLNPWVVAGHFLVSMFIIMVCVALLDELRSPQRPLASRAQRLLAFACLGVGWIVLYFAVYVLVLLTVLLLLVALRAKNRWLVLVTALVLAIEVLQGVLGWVQYWLDLPVALVALHMLGAGVLAAGLARITLAVLPHQAPASAETTES